MTHTTRKPSGIPDHWEEIKLKRKADLINVKRDFSPSDEFYVGLENIASWTGEFIATESLSPTGAVSVFDKGDILFGKLRPYLAKVYLAESSGVCSTEALVLRPKPDVSPYFMRYLLSEHGFIFDVDSSTFGAKMPRASWEYIGSRLIAIPPLAEQQRIAAYLDRETARIDALIAKKQRLVALLEEKIETLIWHEIDRFSSDTNQPLHRFCSIITGKTPSRINPDNFSEELGVPWATPANLGSFTPISITKEYISNEGMGGLVSVPPYTVLINGIGASLGKVGISGLELTFNQQIHAIVQNKKQMDSWFLFFILYMKKQEIISLANHTTLPIINSERLGRLVVPIPTLEKQNQAVQRLRGFIQQAEIVKPKVLASIEKLREYRSALITAAVTGQVEV